MNSFFKLDLQMFAHKKGGGVAATNRSHDSNSKCRGVKKFGGEKINSGSIIVTQLGTKYLTGKNTYLSANYSIHSKINGIVNFYCKKVNNTKRTFVEVLEKKEQIEEKIKK